MSLPIYPNRQTPSAQYRQLLMGVTGDALCLTWRLSWSWSYSYSISSPKSHTTHSLWRGHGSGTQLRNSSAWGWHNSHQSGVVSITNRLILQNGNLIYNENVIYGNIIFQPKKVGRSAYRRIIISRWSLRLGSWADLTVSKLRKIYQVSIQAVGCFALVKKQKFIVNNPVILTAKSR